MRNVKKAEGYVDLLSAGGNYGGLRPARIGFAVLLLALAAVSMRPSAYASDGERDSTSPHINVSTEPERLHPHSEEVTVRVSVKGLPSSSTGHRVHLTLDAPSSDVLSTDFPIVEGTRLLDLTAELQENSFAFDYRFPIRGTYDVHASVFHRDGEASSPLVNARRSIHVSEHPSDLRNASLLFVGLFLLGLLSGIVVRRSAIRSDGGSTGSATTSSGILFLVASAGLLTTPLYAHGPGGHETHERAKALPDHVEGDHGTLHVDVSPDDPDVGELMTVKARFSEPEAGAPSPARFVVECVNLEEGYAVFRMSTVERSGTLQQRIQFVDGAPHHVRVKAKPLDQGEPEHEEPALEVGTSVDVTAIPPPTNLVVRMMSILLGVFVVGLIGGYLSQSYAGYTGTDAGAKPSSSSGEDGP